jgi:type IV fimbrial biogenesis protein FimT
MKNGFTIIELMLAIMVLSIVVAMGVPTLSSTIQNNRLASQTNSLLSTLNYARSEAVKLGSSVTICGSSDQAACNSSNWEDGWIVFRDSNGNGAVNAGETILRVQEPLSGGNTLRTSGFSSASNLVFNSRGMLAATGTFVLCDSRGASDARGVVMNISGQARAAVDENSPADAIVNLHRTNNALAGNVTCP